MAYRIKCGRCGKETNRRITLADAPPAVSSVSENNEDFQLRVWAFMTPPKISGTSPIIPPERLEKVRRLLDRARAPDEGVLETRVDSRLNIQMMQDGTMKKIITRNEVRRYPVSPTLVMARSNPNKKKFCRPTCEQTTEAELDDIIGQMCEKKYLEMNQYNEDEEAEEYAEGDDGVYLEDDDENYECN